MANRIVLSEYKSKKAAEAGIEIETEGGTVFVVPPPALWPDKVLEFQQGGDMIAVARALIGERYDEFVDAGGSAAVLASIVADELGATPGESPASSS